MWSASRFDQEDADLDDPARVSALKIAEQKRQEDEAASRADLQRLMQDRRGEHDGSARRRPVLLVPVLRKTQRAALELLAVEVDRHGEATMRRNHLGIIAVAVRLAAPRARVAPDAHALPARDRILK